MGDFMGGRRPLRFLARRLNLQDDQFLAVANVLSELRTARQQAALDERRAMSRYAAALEASAFTPELLQTAQQERMQAAQALHDAIAQAIERLHGLLDVRQRAELALLLREAPPWLS